MEAQDACGGSCAPVWYFGDRTSILYTPKLSNVSATVVQVKTNGDKADAFTDDGKIEVKAGQSFAIDKVRLVEDKNSQYFKVTYSSDGKVNIALSDKASGMKAGKYTVKYNVSFKDAAANEKPVTMKMTVTVK